MNDPRRRLGQSGEAFAASHLERAGYTLLARNWHHGKSGELDLVMRREDEIVFVEVRTRRGPLEAAIEAALASITPTKQARLARLAQAYLMQHNLEGVRWRIDVAAVGVQADAYTVEIIPDAVTW